MPTLSKKKSVGSLHCAPPSPSVLMSRTVSVADCLTEKPAFIPSAGLLAETSILVSPRRYGEQEILRRSLLRPPNAQALLQ